MPKPSCIDGGRDSTHVTGIGNLVTYGDIIDLYEQVLPFILSFAGFKELVTYLHINVLLWILPSCNNMNVIHQVDRF